MKLLYIKLLYYLWHFTYIIGMKYIYIPLAHSLYSRLMGKSAELDTEGKFWGKPLPQPEKDEV